MNSLMKQAQKMQKDIERKQAELEELVVEATSGGGVVKVAITGKKVVKSLEIKPEAVDPDDVEMLQDLIIAAMNEAIKKVEDHVNGEMGKITGMGGMPGMF